MSRLHPCTNGSHLWLHEADARRCCAGYVRVWVPSLIAWAMDRLDAATADQDRPAMEVALSVLAEMYRIRGQAPGAEGERSFSRRWIPQSDADLAAFLQTLLPSHRRGILIGPDEYGW